MHVRADGSDEQVADAPEGPCDSILHKGVLVCHHVDEHGQRLVHERSQNVRVGALENRPECHHGGFTQVPVRSTDVGLNEWNNCRDDRVLNGLCEEGETC